jgi:hypothetical protein
MIILSLLAHTPNLFEKLISTPKTNKMEMTMASKNLSSKMRLRFSNIYLFS